MFRYSEIEVSGAKGEHGGVLVLPSQLCFIASFILVVLFPGFGFAQSESETYPVCPVTGNRDWMTEWPIVDEQIDVIINGVQFTVPQYIMRVDPSLIRNPLRETRLTLLLSLASLPDIEREGCVASNLRASLGFECTHSHTKGLCSYENAVEANKARDNHQRITFDDVIDPPGLQFITARQTLEEFIQDPRPTYEDVRVWRDAVVPQIPNGEKDKPWILWEISKDTKMRCKFPGSGNEFQDLFFSNCELHRVYNFEGLGLHVELSSWHENFIENYDEINSLAERLPELFNMRRAN